MVLFSPASSCSTANNVTSPDQSMGDALRILLAVVYSLIFILGLVGNLVALSAYFLIKAKKNSMRVFLINLVFADLLLVVCLPFRIFYHIHNNTWTMPPILCKIVSCLFYTNMYISIIVLGLISVDRYMKINSVNVRMQRRLLSPKSSRVVCAVVWIGVSALTLSLYMSGELNKTQRCFHYKSLQQERWKAYINMLALGIFWMVFTALMVSYGRIAHKLLKRSRERPEMPNAPQYARTAKKSFFILFVFTFCFIPYHLLRPFYIMTQINDSLCDWINVADKANEVALLFTASNSCLDPVMYFLLSSSVRKEMLQMVNRVLHVQHAARVSESTTSSDRQA